MRTINVNSKKGEYYTKLYSSWGVSYDIYDAYDRPSYNKVRAFNECEKRCKEENGQGLCIIGHNSCTFTVAWRTNEGLRIETANNSYIVK